ncbi:MAG: 2Fe-2S iron-sulfur cluster-binding protein [Alkalispirochaetaceae bacterium]
MRVRCWVDGKQVELTIDPLAPLAELMQKVGGLREPFSRCHGRESFDCLLCSVILDGRVVSSCRVPAYRAEGAQILTYDGFREEDEAREIENAFLENGTELCDSCRAGVILITHALVHQAGGSDPVEIRQVARQLQCRCINPTDFVRAVYSVSEGHRPQGPRVRSSEFGSDRL